MLPVPFLFGAAVGGLLTWSAKRHRARVRAHLSPEQLAQLAGETLERAGLLQVLRIEPLRGGRAVDIHGRLLVHGEPVRTVVRAFSAGRATEIDLENLAATGVIAGAPVTVLVSEDGFTRAARATEPPGSMVLLDREGLARIGAGAGPWMPRRPLERPARL